MCLLRDSGLYHTKLCFSDVTSEEKMLIRLNKSVDTFLKYAQKMTKDSSVEIKCDYLPPDIKVNAFYYFLLSFYD